MSIEGFYSDPDGDSTVLGCLGIDTGPHTGVFAAWWDREDWKLLDALAFECAAAMAVPMLRTMLGRKAALGQHVQLAGIEAFVARSKAVRLAGVRIAAMHAQQAEIRRELAGRGIYVAARPAGTVKPWATDKRLEAAGLLKLAGSSPHIRDAGRHMLFGACQAGLPDPLSAIARTGGRTS